MGGRGFKLLKGVIVSNVKQDVPGSEMLLLEIIDRLDRMERAQSLTVVKEAYTTGDAAERLGRSEWTVRQWCNQGQVEGAYKVRGKGRTGEWRLTHEAVVNLQAKGPAPVGTHLVTGR